MKMPRLRPILVCLVALALAAVAAGQEAPLVPVSFHGTEAFGHFLHSLDLKPVPSTADLATLAPEKTLIVIFGDLAKLDAGLSAAKLEAFHQQGGALLLASDYPDRRRLPFGMACGGHKVRAEGVSVYQEKWEECPIVRATNPSHPAFRTLTKGIATNNPSFLLSQAPDWRRLAGFADDCLWIDPLVQGPVRVPDGAGYIFGSPAGAGPAGRTLILAGQGMFLNGMLFQTDNDNFAFTWNAIEWLSDGPRGRREHALFINNGKVVGSFALPLTKFGPVPMPRVEIINQLLRGLEDENFFNEKLIEAFGKDRILRGLLLLASAVALVLAGRRIMHGRYRLDTAAPLLVGKQAAAPPPMPVLWQRREELRRRENLWEPAQVLARQFFLDHASITVPLWDDETAAPPAVTAAGGFWQRRSLTRRVHKLWRLARATPAQPVAPKEFDELLRTLSALTAAIDAGELRLTTHSGVPAAHVHQRIGP